MNSIDKKPIGVIYEHSRWFNPLFEELDLKEIPFTQINPLCHVYDPASVARPYNVVYNDMSLTYYNNEFNRNILSRMHYALHLERLGIDVINGSMATEIENSKAKQLLLLASLKFPFPVSRIVSTVDHLLESRNTFRYPIILKSNFGCVGRVIRVDSAEHLEDKLINDSLGTGIDNSFLLQELVPAKGGHFVRVETLNGKVSYALKIFVPAEYFSIWPLEVKMEIYASTPNNKGC